MVNDSTKPIIIVDANILMSALITHQGRVANALIESSERYHFVSCHFLYVELFKHKAKMLKASRLAETDFLELLLGLLNRIEFVNESLLSADIISRAKQLVQDIDPRDVYYVALSIHHNAPIWTGDQKLLTGLHAKGFTQIGTTATLNL